MSTKKQSFTRVGIIGLTMVVATGFKAFLTLYLRGASDPGSIWVTVVIYATGVGMIFWSIVRGANEHGNGID